MHLYHQVQKDLILLKYSYKDFSRTNGRSKEAHLKNSGSIQPKDLKDHAPESLLHEKKEHPNLFGDGTKFELGSQFSHRSLLPVNLDGVITEEFIIFPFFHQSPNVAKGSFFPAEMFITNSGKISDKEADIHNLWFWPSCSRFSTTPI